jgi:preprotein translocase subunit YajC
MRGQYLYALQEEPRAPEGAHGPSLIGLLPPFIIFFIIMWLLILRPEKRRQRERQAMISSLKKNDHVLTSGGIYGIIHTVRDNDVILKLDERGDLRIRVAKSAIVGIERSSVSDPDQKRQKK